MLFDSPLGIVALTVGASMNGARSAMDKHLIYPLIAAALLAPLYVIAGLIRDYYTIAVVIGMLLYIMIRVEGHSLMQKLFLG